MRPPSSGKSAASAAAWTPGCAAKRSYQIRGETRPCDVGVCRQRQVQHRDVNVRLIESSRQQRRAAQRSHEETRDDDKQERAGDLADEEHTAQPEARAASSTRGLQRGHQIPARGVQRRREAGNHRGQQRYQRREREDSRVDRHVDPDRNGQCRKQCEQQAAQPAAEHDTQPAAGCEEDDRLPRRADAPAASATRRLPAVGSLPLARRGARQQHARQVDARDQQHHADDRHQQAEEAREDVDVAGHDGGGHRRQALPSILVRVFALEVVADRGEFRVRLREVTPGLSRPPISEPDGTPAGEHVAPNRGDAAAVAAIGSHASVRTSVVP